MKTLQRLLFIFVFLFGGANFLWAKEKSGSKEKMPVRSETSFGISPPIIDLECPPGQRVTTQIKIENPHQPPAAYLLEPVGPVPSGVNTLVNKPIATLPPDHLSRHIHWDGKEIIIPGKSYKQVDIFIDVPATLKGTHYTGLTVSNTSPSMEEPGLQRPEEYRVKLGVGLQPGIGITIKCHIKGTLQPSLTLNKIKTNPRSGNQPMSLSAEIKNTGNSEIYLLATLILLDPSGKVVARMKAVNPVTIVPGSVAEVPFQPLFKEIPNGGYKAILSSANPKLKLPALERHVTIQ